MKNKLKFNFAKISYLLGAGLFALSMLVSTQTSTLSANSDLEEESCTELCQMGTADCGSNCQKR